MLSKKGWKRPSFLFWREIASSTKGWRRSAVGIVLVLMLSSLSIVFLLGFHGVFLSRQIGDDDFSILNSKNGSRVVNQSKPVKTKLRADRKLSKHLGDILNKLESEPSRVLLNTLQSSRNISGKTRESLDKLLTKHPITSGFSDKPVSSSLSGVRTEKEREKLNHKNNANDFNAKSQSENIGDGCEFELGSYCNWRNDRKVVMADATVRMLKNQLFLARAYYPSIVKHYGHENFQHELRKHIQDIERMLSVATVDADLPASAKKKTKVMEDVLAKAKSYPVDCNNVIRKLAQILDLTEDETLFHQKQSVFLYQLATQTMPKGLHCLSLRLTVEYFRSNKGNIEVPSYEKLESSDFYHYVIYSTNILAASVVVNSTIVHAKEPDKHVFHFITDKENHAAMKFWFHESDYGNATVHVECLDDLNLLDLSNPMETLSSEEFRVVLETTAENTTGALTLTKKLKYLSTFNHPHFWLADIFPKLNKVILLDDDIVVQRDLTSLWSIDLQGKINGAVEVCDVKFYHLRKYLHNSETFSNGFEGNACAWTSGINIIDLQEWRKQKLTEVYHSWSRLKRDNISWRFGTLPASLVTFYNKTYPLDESWLMSGLGHNFDISQQDLRSAAVLHYNGNLKPWLDIGIKQYKPFWSRYLKKGDQFMLDCNVNG